MRGLVVGFGLISGCFAHEAAMDEGPPCGEGERIARLEEARRHAAPVLETPCPEGGAAPVPGCPKLERHGEAIVLSVAIPRGEAPIFTATLYVRRPGSLREIPLKQGADDTWTAAVPVGDGEPWDLWLEAWDELGNGPGQRGTRENPLRVRFVVAP